LQLFTGEFSSESEVNQSSLKSGFLLHRRKFLETQFYARVSRLVITYQTGKKGARSRAEKTNRQLSNLSFRRTSGRIHGNLCLRERTDRFRIEDFAFRCELHGTLRPLEQLQPKLLLQIGHRLADSRLRNINLPGGLTITLPLHDGGEVSKVP